uniref:Uncharacterized protein n=1 Tax=Anguilla anguilla TaxID=7936 RepID=A0A0E9SE95_ANGAN
MLVKTSSIADTDMKIFIPLHYISRFVDLVLPFFIFLQ